MRVHAVHVAAGIAAALFIGLGGYLAPLEPSVLALQLTFTPRAFGTIVHVWPPEHLARYRAHLPVDMLLLAAYGAFGWLLATRTALWAGAATTWRRLATWALPLAAVFDALENVLHWWLTASPRFGLPAVYALAGGAAAAKWALVLVFTALVAHALSRPG